jgi:Neutral/alkaline non-lysosomal ceramidase, N-terminal
MAGQQPPRTRRPTAAAIVVGLAFVSLPAWAGGHFPAQPGDRGAGQQARVAGAPAFQAGVATKVITPREPLWMAGYAGRNKPSEGTEHDLYLKALAVDDADGTTLVFLTSDLIGVPRESYDAVASELARRAQVPRERFVWSSSHTHSGPVLAHSLTDMYPLDAEQTARIDRYTRDLERWAVETALAALADRKPARLSFGNGTAKFAINRRQATERGFAIGRNPSGPVDTDVPVLRVEGDQGAVRAIVFGYACHNTTLDYYRWCGDYAGFAQIALESKHPGAAAMFWSGCGADANPDPRRTVEHAQQHGRSLAEAVETALGKTTPIAGRWAARSGETSLAFAQTPSREEWQAQLRDQQLAVRQRATRYLKVLDANQPIPTEYGRYPVHVWRLGDGPLWVSLGGEVVVDYALRLKKELAGPRPVWVTAYANDVMAYIPSERVLREGGYEADSSMIYYGQPSRWAPGLEAKIVNKVHELVRELK